MQDEYTKVRYVQEVKNGLAGAAAAAAAAPSFDVWGRLYHKFAMTRLGIVSA